MSLLRRSSGWARAAESSPLPSTHPLVEQHGLPGETFLPPLPVVDWNHYLATINDPRRIAAIEATRRYLVLTTSRLFCVSWQDKSIEECWLTDVEPLDVIKPTGKPLKTGEGMMRVRILSDGEVFEENWTTRERDAIAFMDKLSELRRREVAGREESVNRDSTDSGQPAGEDLDRGAMASAAPSFATTSSNIAPEELVQTNELPSETGIGHPTPDPYERDLIPATEGTQAPTGYFGIKDQTGASWWLNRDALERSPASTPLSRDQVERIRAFKEVFAEHDRTSLGKAVTNFQRDGHPEPEIRLWERMARVYTAELRDRPSADDEERKLLFQALLACSFGAADPQAAIEIMPELDALTDLARVVQRF